MPITAEQIIERRQWIGASDIAPILGLSTFKTAADIWAEKTGRVTDAESSEAADAGNRFENAVLDWASEQLGQLARNVQVRAQGIPLVANMDAQLVAGKVPVEAKTSGLFGPLQEEWGPYSTDEVPSAYIVQCQAIMLCSEQDLCHLAAFLGGRGFGMYHIRRAPSLIDLIARRCQEFWKCVETDTPPAGSTLSLEVAKRLRREPGKVIQIDAGAVAKWRQARDTRLQAEKDEDATQAVLLACLGDAECGDSSMGRVSYTQSVRNSLDTKALRENEPEIAATYMRESTYRTLRLKEGKAKS